MPIRYQIVGNNLKPGRFTARVVRGRRVDLDTMITNIVARTSLSTADVRGAVTALVEEVRTVLAAGDTAVIDRLATFSTNLSGSFSTPDATISRDSAQMHVAVQADNRLQTFVATNASYERQVSDIKAPIITSFYDVASDVFDRYTPGSVVRLAGDNLKFDASRSDEGVFLHDGITETRVTIYSVNGTRQIDALLPGAIRGQMQIAVRTRYTPNGQLREGRFVRAIAQS